jgi:hypothetical protein
MALIRARYATPVEIEHDRNAIRDAEAAPVACWCPVSWAPMGEAVR